MIRITLRAIAWLLVLLLAIVLFVTVGLPAMVIYLALVAVATPFMLVTLPWARIIVWKLVGEYLVGRRVAWMSLIAVSLCVWLVLVVLSVMSGWLLQFRNQFHTLTGDLVVSRNSSNNFGYYEDLIAEFKKQPGVVSAVPILRTVGLLAIPTGNGHEWKDMVEVVGIPPIDELDKVMAFSKSLWLQHDIAEWSENGEPLRTEPSFKLYDDVPYTDITPRDKQALKRPGMILGAGLIGVKLNPTTHKPEWTDELNWLNSRLTVLPTSDELGPATTNINATTTPYWVVDGSRTQAPQHDGNIYVPFDQLQKDLNLTAYQFEDAVTHVVSTEPAKTSEIHIKLKDGVNVAAVKDSIQGIIDRMVAQHPSEGPPLSDEADASGKKEGVRKLGAIEALAWDEQPKTKRFLSAVENEITIMMTLFGFISLVAVFMIFCIFYTIVAEKTRDIGILKSTGSSSWSVAQVFITYGAAIGFVGGGIGIGMGWGTVTYINQINGWVGKMTGREIYSSDIYAIDKLPSHVDVRFAIIIWAIGIIAAIGGALVPAVLAARKNPVEALRFE